MAIVKCVNGHFYDMSKTKECPYCKQRDENRSQLQSRIRDGHVFSVDVSSPMNEEVTRAMPSGGGSEINLGPIGRGRAQMSGLSGSEDGVTMGFFKRHLGTAYVTGWLVCVEGSEVGRDYRIIHGMNWVGRSQNMDICINENDTISRDKHCAIVYDGKSNEFFIAQGSGTLTYVNGEMLKGSRKLEMGDEITIGNCKFEFIPFCREGHTWNREEIK